MLVKKKKIKQVLPVRQLSCCILNIASFFLNAIYIHWDSRNLYNCTRLTKGISNSYAINKTIGILPIFYLSQKIALPLTLLLKPQNKQTDLVIILNPPVFPTFI